jgi:hypothetical protein
MVDNLLVKLAIVFVTPLWFLLACCAMKKVHGEIAKNREVDATQTLDEITQRSKKAKVTESNSSYNTDSMANTKNAVVSCNAPIKKSMFHSTEENSIHKIDAQKHEASELNTSKRRRNSTEIKSGRESKNSRHSYNSFPTNESKSGSSPQKNPSDKGYEKIDDLLSACEEDVNSDDFYYYID